VTGLLVGVYAGLVLLTTQVFGIHTPVAVAALTLTAAALLNPVRRRVQKRVDRRFNRARYDADQAVAVLGARLKDAVDLDSVRDDLANIVHQALEPPRIAVDQPTRLSLAPAGSAAVKPGPLTKCRCGTTRSSAVTCTNNPRSRTTAAVSNTVRYAHPCRV
jgi:hypothetical protein